MWSYAVSIAIRLGKTTQNIASYGLVLTDVLHSETEYDAAQHSTVT
jgi:hypothetical protein